MAKKKATPPSEGQFDEVAPPGPSSFTTSTPNPVSGRIVSGSDVPQSSGPSDEAPTAESLRGKLEEVDRLSRVGKELSEAPVRKTRKNASRTPGTGKAAVPIRLEDPADAFRLKILADINADELATHTIARTGAITKAKNAKLTKLYKDHNKNPEACTSKHCPARDGGYETRDEYLATHGHLSHVIKAKADAEALAEHEYDNAKDPVTGELVNAFKPRTLDTLNTHQQQHVERVYKLAEMLHADHVANATAAGATPLDKEAYSPDKVLSAVNSLIGAATGKTYYKAYTAGLGKRVRHVADTEGTMEQLPSISTEPAQKFSHQELVSALFDAMNKSRSRPLQLNNPGSGIARRLAAAESPQARDAIRNAYDAETAIHRGGAAPFVADLHKILGAVSAESKGKKKVERERRLGRIDNDTARTIKAMKVEENTGLILPKITGEQLDAQAARENESVMADRQQRYEDHEAQHSATQKINLAKIGRNASKKARASAITNTCHSETCNAARARSEDGSISLDAWTAIHANDVTSPSTRVRGGATQTTASEGRRRVDATVDAALASRTPGAVSDLVGQGNTTAAGAGTAVPNNNADDAVNLSDIRRQIKAGAILVPGSSDRRPRGQVSDDRPAPIPAVLNRTILRRHFDQWSTLPRRVQQHMLSFPIEHHDKFLSDYATHNANERSKVQAADKAGQMYTPKDFTFTP